MLYNITTVEMRHIFYNTIMTYNKKRLFNIESNKKLKSVVKYYERWNFCNSG